MGRARRRRGGVRLCARPGRPALLLDEHAPTPSHALLDAKLLAISACCAMITSWRSELGGCGIRDAPYMIPVLVQLQPTLLAQLACRRV
ncbi:hypothetical protein T492DRAFT_1065559, partial [Pavlovales sp. CCMP2436]